MKMGVMLGALLGLVPVLLPVLLEPSTAGAVLLHGSTGITLVLVVGLVGLISFIAKRQRSVDGQPSDKVRKLSRVQLIGLFAAILLAVFGSVFVGQFLEYRSLVAIEQHGHRAAADVVRIYTDGCGRSSCSIKVEYRYAPAPAATPLIGYGYLASDRHPDDPRLLQARATGHVPIAYDVAAPARSALNFDDSVFKVDHAQRLIGPMKMMGWMLLLCLGLPALLIAFVPASSRKPAAA